MRRSNGRSLSGSVVRSLRVAATIRRPGDLVLGQSPFPPPAKLGTGGALGWLTVPVLCGRLSAGLVRRSWPTDAGWVFPPG